MLGAPGDIRKMQALFKQLGIKTRQIPAKRVLIETEEYTLVLEEPEVVEISAQGQISYSLTPTKEPRREERISEEDVKLVMEKANVSREVALEALKKANGDVAEAILLLEE